MTRTISCALLLSFVASCTVLSRPIEAVTATTTTLSSSANPVVIGQSVAYTVTVTAAGSGPLTGPVRITFNGNNGPDYSLHNGTVVW